MAKSMTKTGSVVRRGQTTKPGGSMKTRLGGALVVATAVALAAPGTIAFAANKAGGSCKVAGQISGKLTCTAKGRKKVWSVTPVTTAAPVTTATLSRSSCMTYLRPNGS